MLLNKKIIIKKNISYVHSSKREKANPKQSRNPRNFTKNFRISLNKLRLFFKTFLSRPTKMQMFEFCAWQPEETADFSRRHHWLPREMTSEENFPRSTTNQKHYPHLISMEFPRSLLRRREMSTVFSGYACHSRPKSYCDPFAQHHGSKALADPKPEVANHRLPAFCAVSNMRNTGTKMSNYCACAIFCSQLRRSVPLAKRIVTLGTELLYYCTQTFLSGRGDWCIRNTWSWRRISILLASLSFLSRRFNCWVRSRIVRLDFAKEKKRQCYW